MTVSICLVKHLTRAYSSISWLHLKSGSFMESPETVWRCSILVTHHPTSTSVDNDHHLCVRSPVCEIMAMESTISARLANMNDHLSTWLTPSPTRAAHSTSCNSSWEFWAGFLQKLDTSILGPVSLVIQFLSLRTGQSLPPIKHFIYPIKHFIYPWTLWLKLDSCFRLSW